MLLSAPQTSGIRLLSSFDPVVCGNYCPRLFSHCPDAIVKANDRDAPDSGVPRPDRRLEY